MSERPRIAIWWARRDLRLEDNHALFQALRSGDPVLPLFIFDTDILDKLEDPADRRVDLIHRILGSLEHRLEERHGGLLVLHGRPIKVWTDLLTQYDIRSVFAANDHEPYGIARDKAVHDLLKAHGIPFHGVKDISIFERDEVLKDDGTPYLVFTPYMRRWRERFDPSLAEPYPSQDHLDRLHRTDPLSFPTLADIGYRPTDLALPELDAGRDLLKDYQDQRNFPGERGNSHASVHLRFGTVSVRELVRRALDVSHAYLNELIWREFFMAILYHHPRVVKESFRPAYDAIEWVNDEELFTAWCEGRTGYPMVDAGMRELAATGLMHGRVRMVVASFLCKHLLVDHRWGEAWFAAKLLDFELSSNNGNWQWCAGSGVDAAPYFRIFDPARQQERFDPQLKYVKHWVPELGTTNYARPIVVHQEARRRALATYQAALKPGPLRAPAKRTNR
ncbi:MAG: deoxyribodipyrimidine photo-lyase [Flavobacteriales bacterium]|nr:deoxyribodipyrimidine photo-lyase [Flavobacteriales bacterium]